MKHYRVRIEVTAADELDHIFQFISQDSPNRAKKFIQSLSKKILSLKHFPRRGSRVLIWDYNDADREIRFIEFKRYVIIYRILEKDVRVLHVAGPGQDWKRKILYEGC